MQVVRVYIPDLGDATFKAIEVDDKCTVSDVQEKLIAKLINAGTVDSVDSSKFTIYESTNNSAQGKMLKSGEKIVVLTKKWAKKNKKQYKLLFKGTNGAKLQTACGAYTPAPPTSQQTLAQLNSSVQHATIAHFTPVPPRPTINVSISQPASVTSTSNACPPEDDGTPESALALLNYFEGEYNNNKIHNMLDIITTLGGQ